MGRLFERVLVSIPCNLLWENQVTDGRIVNLSVSGAAVDVVEEIPQGTDVSLKIQTDRGEVDLIGKVVHGTEPPEGGNRKRLGVEFLEMAPERSSKLVSVFLKYVDRPDNAPP